MNTPKNKPKLTYEDLEPFNDALVKREEAIPRFNHDLAEDEAVAFHRVDLSLWDSKKVTETT